MYYPVCDMVYIKYPLLLIEKSSPCSISSRIPLSLYEWPFTICLTPYNYIKNVFSLSLIKHFLPSFTFGSSFSVFTAHTLIKQEASDLKAYHHAFTRLYLNTLYK